MDVPALPIRIIRVVDRTLFLTLLKRLPLDQALVSYMPTEAGVLLVCTHSRTGNSVTRLFEVSALVNGLEVTFKDMDS